MKRSQPPPDDEELDRSRSLAEQCWLGPICLLFWVLVILAFLLSGCGGTFTLRPDGSLSYTTPEIIKAPIVEETK